MITHHDDGRPYSYDGLVDSFALRVMNLRDIAEWLAKDDRSSRLSALQLAISFLHDDWEVFEKALGEWHEREHPEDYAEEQQDTPKKGTQR